MNKDKIKEMCNDIYEGGDWKPMIDLIEQKDKKIKELNDKIEDDKMIIEGNWGCIDNLRKDYNAQKKEIERLNNIIDVLEIRINNCAKYLRAREDHDFNADIPISILNGNINHIKEYLDKQIKIYEELEYEYTEEMNCLKDILEDLLELKGSDKE